VNINIVKDGGTKSVEIIRAILFEIDFDNRDCIIINLPEAGRD
jgi:hypothetical protein